MNARLPLCKADRNYDGDMRFRPQFTLRTIFAFVTLACVACAFSPQFRDIRARRAFIYKLAQNGWSSTRDGNLDSADSLIVIRADAPQELIEEAHRLFPAAMIGRSSDDSFDVLYPLLGGRCRGGKVALLKACECGKRKSQVQTNALRFGPAGTYGPLWFFVSRPVFF